MIFFHKKNSFYKQEFYTITSKYSVSNEIF